ncbi:MAG: hypothetical protein WAU01_08010 [Saprospiraceae bacterium]
MGIYANKLLYDWFVDEHAKRSEARLDMGKSCIRYKKPASIPYDLIGELVSKTTPEQWIDLYESFIKPRN